MVRSKIDKGPDGYGRVIQKSRELMLQKEGHVLPSNIVPMHKKPGSHFESNGGSYVKGTQSDNIADSNRARAKKVKDKLSTK